MSINKIAAYLLLALTMLLSGCGSPTQYKETQFLMDTVIEITAYGPNAEEAVKEAFLQFKRIHDLSNRYDPDSQVSRINQAAGRESLKVDPDLTAIAIRAAKMSVITSGKFDITVGTLTDLWGIGRKGDYIPTEQEIEAARKLVDYRKVAIDQERNTIYLTQPGMALDLGGIAKRYALDKAGSVLAAKGIKSALINAGGDINVIGKRPDGQPWRIGVQHPRQTDALIAKLTMDPWISIETSGDYQRFIIKDNERYAHIIDPDTGRPAAEVTSVTLVSRDASPAIRSSAIFTLGIEKGLELLKQYPNTEAIITAGDGRVITTPGLRGSIELEK